MKRQLQYLKKPLALLLYFFIAFNSMAQGVAFEWAKRVGKVNDDEIPASICTTTLGEVINTGFFNGTVDFDPGTSTFNMTTVIANRSDVYVSKLDETGNFMWAKRIGGNDNDYPVSAATDLLGNIYIIACFTGTVDLDPGPGVYNITSSGDICLIKLNAAGVFQWGKEISTPNVWIANHTIHIGTTGNVYTLGNFRNTVDFDPGVGTFFMTAPLNSQSMFVSVFNPSGNFLWAVQTEEGYTEAQAFVLDDNNQLYITGSYSGTVDFDSGPGITSITSPTIYNETFIAKLDNTGGISWVKQLSSLSAPNNVFARSIAIDSLKNVYTYGDFRGPVDFDPGIDTFEIVSQVNRDCFVSKLDSLGDFVWAKNFGSPNPENPTSMCIDSDANIYLTGSFDGTVDFNPGPDTYNLTSASLDIFINKLDKNGAFIFAKKIGSTSIDYATDIWLHNDQYLYTTGVFIGLVDFDLGANIYNLNSVGGKDIFILKMERCLNSYTTISATVCNNYTSPSGQYTWSTSGTYTDILTNAVGCDSIITVNLTVRNSIAEIFPYDCVSYISPDGNSVWTASGTYLDTIPNSNGCDSIITIHLTIGNSSSLQYLSACNSMTSPSGNEQWLTSGTYHDTIPNHLGCDSLITVNLTILHSHSEIFPFACTNYLSPDENNLWTTSGIYYDTILNTAGCDSTIIIHLTVLNTSNSFIDTTVCASLLSPSGHYNWSTSGVYSDTIPNAAGCDSIITINLNVQNTFNEITAFACNTYLSPDGTTNWNTSGTYSVSVPNAAGCDSIITIHLQIGNSNSVANITECDSYTSPSGNYTWFNSGTYLDTLPNSIGCDSIITTHLIITPPLTIQTSLNALTISTVQTGSFYQWLSCNNGYQVILNQTNQSFTPIENGDYAVIVVSQNGCPDTSECVSITTIGIDEVHLENHIVCFPNPTTGNLTINLDKKYSNTHVLITDIIGKPCYEHFYENESTLKIDLDEPTGIYMLIISTDENNTVLEVILE